MLVIMPVSVLITFAHRLAAGIRNFFFFVFLCGGYSSLIILCVTKVLPLLPSMVKK